MEKKKKIEGSTSQLTTMSESSVNLPEEIMTDILLNLPVKSLCRFKCVSKPWGTLISNPHFIKAHMNRTKTNREIIVLSPDHLHAVSQDYSRPLMRNNKHCEKIMGSCNGLVLLYKPIDFLDYDTGYILVNPATQEAKEVCSLPYYNFISYNCFITGLCYDAVEDDYKVLRVSYRSRYGCDNEAILYSLKTNSWESIQDLPVECVDLKFEDEAGILNNGNLHWFGAPNLALEYLGPVPLPLILSFNPVDKQQRIISPPDSLVERWAPMQLGTFRDFLCVTENLEYDGLDVWIMKEYGVKESWTKFITIDDPNGDSIGYPWHFWTEDQIVMEIDHDENEYESWPASLLGLRRKKPRMGLAVFNIDDGRTINWAMDGISNMVDFTAYAESLVSPNGRQLADIGTE